MDPADALALEGTRWRLAEYSAPTGDLIPVPAEVEATATFADGRVAGSAGCNRYFGAYSLRGGSLTLDGPIGTTMMACPEPQSGVERAFLAVLPKVASYTIAGDGLELRTADGEVGLRFTVERPASLTGTPWEARSVNDGRGGVGSVIGGTTLTARFGDGRVAGSAGCNTYSGPYALDGAALSVGPLASTRKACPEPVGVMAQEAAYLAALTRVATCSIEGDRLQLRDADGALQVEYRAAPAG